MKRQPIEWKIKFINHGVSNHVSDKGLIYKI